MKNDGIAQDASFGSIMSTAAVKTTSTANKKKRTLQAKAGNDILFFFKAFPYLF